MMHINDNEEALLDYLYEEGDPAERLKIARHLQDCATCSVAVLELQSVRGLLSEWTPPHAALGFKIVPECAMGDGRTGSRPAGGAPVQPTMGAGARREFFCSPPEWDSPSCVLSMARRA